VWGWSAPHAGVSVSVGNGAISLGMGLTKAAVRSRPYYSPDTRLGHRGRRQGRGVDPDVRTARSEGVDRSGRGAGAARGGLRQELESLDDPDAAAGDIPALLEQLPERRGRHRPAGSRRLRVRPLNPGRQEGRFPRSDERGTASHTFTITGKGIDVVNSPGQSQNVTINLAPGTYQFICRFHVSLGMRGTLTVTG